MSTTAPEDVRARVVLVLAAGEADGLEAAVARVAGAWRDAVGDGGAVRVGVRAEEDPLTAQMGERGALEPVDAVIEVTAADGGSSSDLEAIVTGAADELGDAIDPTRSVVIAGRCFRFLSELGSYFIALAGRRDPAISREQMSEWWLRHGPFALARVKPLPRAYEQLHADPDASQRAGVAAGLPGGSYDMYDTIAIDALSDLQGSLMDPEVAAALYEDEVGNVDHASLRGALQRVVTPR